MEGRGQLLSKWELGCSEGEGKLCVAEWRRPRWRREGTETRWRQLAASLES